MISRVLLDLEKPFEVRPVYRLVITFQEAVGDVLHAESLLCHWLNIIELLTLDADACKIDVLQYKQALEEIKLLSSKNNLPKDYLQLS